VFNRERGNANTLALPHATAERHNAAAFTGGRTMARKPLLAALVALVALAAVSANTPHPALPPLPSAPSAPPPQPQPLAARVPPAAVRGEPPKSPLSIRPLAPEVPPPSGLLVPIPPTGPIIPPAPQVPRVPADIGPVAPASPPPSQILEPVSAVHRFAGTYLGGTASRALVYAEATGKAEVRVYALGGAKEPLARRRAGWKARVRCGARVRAHRARTDRCRT
jgi:hypothetical protein